MKKGCGAMTRNIISFVLVLSLLIGLCGCQLSLRSEQSPTTQQTQPVTVSPGAPTTEITVPTSAAVTTPTRPEIEFHGDQNTPPYFEQLAQTVLGQYMKRWEPAT